MAWLRLSPRPTPAERAERDRARARLIEQERRVQALDRAVQVIGRTIDDERQDAPR